MDAMREPNGRISRSGIYHEPVDAVAINARMRLQSITADEAKDPRRGYVLGCMLLDGAITQDQHDAGVRFGEDMARFYGLTGVPFPSARAQNLFSVRGDGGEVSEDHAIAAKAARFKAHKLRDVLLAVGDIDTGRRALHSVTQVALLDVIEARRWPSHMASYLKRGLNALAKHYGGN